MATGSPSEVAGLLVDLAGGRAPTLGAGRLICLDGPGGSGKTTLAAAIGAATPATVVHMDDLYDGWTGLSHVADQLERLLVPLSRDHPGTYRRYDWHARAYAEPVTVDPCDLLVLEGVASGVSAFAGLATVLAWVWAPARLRLARGLSRDGEGLRAQWTAWMRDEEELFTRERTAERADVHIDGTGRGAPRLA